MGARSASWFNDTAGGLPRPPYISDDTLGWPSGDRHVGAQYAPGRTTSIRCRFGNASTAGVRTAAFSVFYGAQERVERVYPFSVYADYLDARTLRCKVASAPQTGPKSPLGSERPSG